MKDFQKEALNKHYVITLDETIPYVEEHFDNLYFHLIELSILIKKVFKVTPIMYLYVDYEYVHWKTLTIGIPLKDFHGDKSKMESKLSHYIFENFLVHKPSFFKTAISINIDYI